MRQRFTLSTQHGVQNKSYDVYHKMLSDVLMLFSSNYNIIRVRPELLSLQDKKVHIGDYALGCTEFYIK